MENIESEPHRKNSKIFSIESSPQKIYENNLGDEPKIFVGNVPFQCSSEDFRECFKDVK